MLVIFHPSKAQMRKSKSSVCSFKTSSKMRKEREREREREREGGREREVAVFSALSVCVYRAKSGIQNLYTDAHTHSHTEARGEDIPGLLWGRIAEQWPHLEAWWEDTQISRENLQTSLYLFPSLSCEGFVCICMCALCVFFLFSTFCFQLCHISLMFPSPITPAWHLYCLSRLSQIRQAPGMFARSAVGQMCVHLWRITSD